MIFSTLEFRENSIRTHNVGRWLRILTTESNFNHIEKKMLSNSGFCIALIQNEPYSQRVHMHTSVANHMKDTNTNASM